MRARRFHAGWPLRVSPSAVTVQSHLSYRAGQYLRLDADQNGMLSRAELSSYNAGTLTGAFLDRVFEECGLYGGEMVRAPCLYCIPRPRCTPLPHANARAMRQDYRAYVDFVLALEYRQEPASLHFLFRLLDFRHCGFLNVHSLHYFYKVSVCPAR